MTRRRLAYTVTSPECAVPHPMGHSAGFDAAAEDLAGLGYDGVEIQVRAPAELPPGSLTASLAQVGLQAAAIATGPLKAEDGLRLDGDRDVRTRAVSRLRDAVELAAELDALVTIGGVRGAPMSHAEQQIVTGALGAVAAHAAEVGVRLALEPQHRGTGPYLTTVAAARAVIVAHGWNAVGLVADSFHLRREERSWPGALIRAGHLLWHVQLGENHRGPLGTGDLPMTQTLDVLDALGYEGWLVMEHEQHGDSHRAAQRSIATVLAAAAG